MVYHIVICEDEQVFAGQLKEKIASWFAKKEAGCEITCLCSGAQFDAFMKEREVPQLLFMDIDLGDADGVRKVEEYRMTGGRKVPVVFVSSMEDRVLDGYDVSALAFLFKRNYEDKLEHCLERFWKEYSSEMSYTITGNGIVSVVSVHDIYYVETDGRKTAVHTEQETLIEDRPISAFVVELPSDCFLEVYKCIYVNLEHVSRIDKETVILENGAQVMLSRRKRKEVMQAVMKYIGGR